MPREASESLSYHKGKKRYYKWIDGKIKYFGRAHDSFEDAWNAYQEWKRDQENPIDSIEMLPNGRVNAVKLKPGAELGRALADPSYFFDSLAQRIKRSEQVPEPERNRQLASVLDWAISSLKTQQDVATPQQQTLPGPKLSDVRDFWERVRKPAVAHRNKCVNRFEHFLKIVGDMQLVGLRKEHLALYTRQLEMHGLSPNNRKHCCAAVKLVLNFLNKPKAQKAQDYDQYGVHLPPDYANMLKLLNVDSDELTDAEETETKPFPPEAFKTITTAIDAAGDKQFKALWLLACQTGYNMTDFARLKWGESVILNASTPHVRLARIKRGKGKRCHPLAQETLKAIKQYRATLSSERGSDGQFAFLNDGKINRNKSLSPNAIADSLEKYRTAAGVSEDWTFKHLRNIGPNVRLQMKLPIDEEWAFLGHTQKLGEAQKYEFQEPERLSALVNAIAKAYFGKLSPPRRISRE